MLLSIPAIFILLPCAVSVAGEAGKSDCGSCRPPSRIAQLLARNGAVSLAAAGSAAKASDPGKPPAEMVWIPGGEFTMGTDETESYAPEKPAHRVRVDGFWIDKTEVTNAEFAKFVQATGYVTTAERKPDWEELKKQLPPGTQKPADDVLVPGALVFTRPPGRVSLGDVSNWWHWTPGASWRAPDGPGSNIKGRESYPVVQVSMG